MSLNKQVINNSYLCLGLNINTADHRGGARRQPGQKENGTGRTISALMYVKMYYQ